MDNSFVYISNNSSFQDSNLLENLLIKAKKGEVSAFGELYNLYFKKVYSFIYYRVSHKETAEDLAEEVFLKVHAKIENIREATSFEAWLYRIARNLVIDYYRGKKEQINILELENTLFYQDTVIRTIDLNQQQKILMTLIAKLEPDQQRVLKMKFFEDLGNNEIAAIMEKSEGAIRVIQFRGIAKLKELFEEYDI
jgi:RNA polymerase sigma factor (sigma-70 family)